MLLTLLRYKQHEGKSIEWGLKSKFDKINLIVGKNASGKTKTLNIIGNLTKQIARSNKLIYSNGDYEIHFKNQGKTVKYFLKYENKEVVKEKLIIGNKTFLDRDANGVGKIFSKEFNKKMQFQVDRDQIALSTKRDALQHPFLEDLYNWSDHLVHFCFGSQFGKNEITVFVKNDKKKSVIDTKETNRVVSILNDGKKRFEPDFTAAIINDMKAIGYYLNNVDIGAPVTVQVATDIPSNPTCLYVQEKDLPEKTDQFDMSQGMYRALSLIVQITYLEFTNNFGAVLVDDIGEGLDYERSSLLVDLLIKKAQKNKFQLIMSTNDRFVMNSVPLDYWLIIHRKGTNVKYFDKSNSPDLFRRFELTGLNNFDMFSSNYFLENIDEKNSNIH